MVTLVILVAVVLLIGILGEWSDARFQRRHPRRGPALASGPSALPEPLIPSTIQRSSGNG